MYIRSYIQNEKNTQRCTLIKKTKKVPFLILFEAFNSTFKDFCTATLKYRDVQVAFIGVLQFSVWS